MNKIKRLSSLLLSVSLVIGMGVSAFAEPVTLKENTYYYNSPSDAKPAGKLAPQTVEVVGKQGWYKIMTDIGDKWIKIPFEPFTIKIYEDINYYNQINDKKAAGALKAPQNLIVIWENNGWYKIRTYNGDKWVKAPFRARDYTLPEKTNVYYKPNVSNALPAALFQAGTLVTIIGYENGWYKIKTQDNKFLWMKRIVPKANDNIYQGVLEIENEKYDATFKIDKMTKIN